MQVSPSANQTPNISITCKSIICIEKATLSTIVGSFYDVKLPNILGENHVKKFIDKNTKSSHDTKGLEEKVKEILKKKGMILMHQMVHKNFSQTLLMNQNL